MANRLTGTCHLHGDVDCGKIPKCGSDGTMYPGRIQCSRCKTIFCRNGLWKKFGERIEGEDCENWVCRLCLGTCCCRSSDACSVQVPSDVNHSHCHNFRSAYGQRLKRRRKRLQALSTETIRSPKVQRFDSPPRSPPVSIPAIPTITPAHVVSNPTFTSTPLPAFTRLYGTVIRHGTQSLGHIMAEAVDQRQMLHEINPVSDFKSIVEDDTMVTLARLIVAARRSKERAMKSRAARAVVMTSPTLKPKEFHLAPLVDRPSSSKFCMKDILS